MSFGKIQDNDIAQHERNGSISLLPTESPYSNDSKQKSSQQEVLSLKLTANPSESPNTPQKFKDLFSDKKVPRKSDE